MSTNEALAFSLDNELDYERLIIQLAGTRPQLLIDLLKPDLDRFAADFLKAEPQCFLDLAKQQVANMQRVAEFVTLMKAGNLIGAIKLLRETHGYGLKEAKDIVVTVRNQLHTANKLVLPSPNPTSALASAPPLRPKDQAVADALFSAF